jgi:NADH-quinone oxidoreductase subunit C
MADDGFRKGLDDLETGPAASAQEESARGPATGDVPYHPTAEALRTRFGGAVLRHEVVAGDEHVVFVSADRVAEVLRWLHEDPAQDYDLLKDLTAIDYGNGVILQVVYELWSIGHRRGIRLKVELPMERLEIQSAYHIWRAADWMEREVFDMFGVVFTGHPDLRRILMPYNYSEGHPLRKDFPLRGRFSRAEQTRRALSMKTEDHYSPHELEVARRLGQKLPSVTDEGGPGAPNPMPGGAV